jgi:glycerophosphoryl diester phosphodiesterase
MPENTIPAMIKALELGVSTLEMDVVITADKKVVLSHEPFFNHEISTKPDGSPVTEEEEKNLNIYKMPYSEVSSFDVGSSIHPRFPEQKKMHSVKPLLSDVFIAVKQWCKDNDKPLPDFNIETKCLPEGDNIFHPEPSLFCDLLMEVIDTADMRPRCLIQSFDFRTLVYLRKNYPDVRLAALVEPFDKGGMETHKKELGFVPDIYSPAWELVDVAMVESCHLSKMKLIPWTVNDSAVAKKLIAMGVDGIITDYPDRIKR